MPCLLEDFKSNSSKLALKPAFMDMLNARTGFLVIGKKLRRRQRNVGKRALRNAVVASPVELPYTNPLLRMKM